MKSMRLLAGVWLSAAVACAATSPSPVDIILKTISADDQNFARARNYTMIEDKTERDLDSAGAVRKTKTSTYEVMRIDGQRYTRLIRRDGKPVSAEEQRREQRKLDDFAAKQKRRSPSERSKAEDEERQERGEMLRLLPAAFDFRFEPESTVDGRPVYVISAVRKAGFKSHNKRTEVLSKMQGTIWVDKDEFQIVKADIHVMEPVSFGWFVAKLSPGARLGFEQQRVNNEVWLPKRLDIRADVRIMGWPNRVHNQTLTSNYRKFTSDARVVSVSEHAEGHKPVR